MTPDSRDLLPLAEEATGLLKTLAHPARLMICCQLRDGEMSVGEIETTLGIRQPRLSRELAKLRDEGFVTTRRVSKVIFYSLGDRPHVRGLIDGICGEMLGKTSDPATGDRPSPQRHNTPGGFGMFARTLNDTNKDDRHVQP